VEEAVAGTTGDAPESVINIDNIDIDVDNLVDSIDPIGAPFDPSTPNTEVPTSITCNPNRSPREKSIIDMVNKEDAFDDGYDSDGEMGLFNSFPVMAVILRPTFGFIFLKGHISFKNGTYCPLFSHNTTFFKGTYMSSY
jgi:hypothetical protein